MTNGAITILNMQAQIEEQQRQAAEGRLSFTGRAAIIVLITPGGDILCHTADYAQTAELAEELVHDAPVDGQAFFARATTRVTFYGFTDALDDLDLAKRFGMQLSAVDGERAAIFQAVGRYDEALTIRRKAAECRVGFETLGVLAGQLESAATMDGEHYDQP